MWEWIPVPPPTMMFRLAGLVPAKVVKVTVSLALASIVPLVLVTLVTDAVTIGGTAIAGVVKLCIGVVAQLLLESQAVAVK